MPFLLLFIILAALTCCDSTLISFSFGLCFTLKGEDRTSLSNVLYKQARVCLWTSDGFMVLIKMPITLLNFKSLLGFI